MIGLKPRFSGIFACVWALSLVLVGGSACGEPTRDAAGDVVDSVALDAGPQAGTFRALTYNIHGLPAGITGDDTEARLKQIGPRLNTFEVVGLQEDWIKDYWPDLDAAAKHPHRERFDAKKAVADGDVPKIYGAGLTFYSDFAATKSAPQHFDKCQGYGDNASDCLASKGFQFLRLALTSATDGPTLDVYNTHMEAGGSSKDDDARVEHGATILAAIAANSAGRAVIFMGDTNLRKLNKDGSINAIETKLLEDFEAVLTDSCAATKCPADTHIDRVFFRSGDDVELKATAWANLSADFRDDKGVDLSDHPPLAVDFAWSKRSE